jgi:hypothetical protein
MHSGGDGCGELFFYSRSQLGFEKKITLQAIALRFRLDLVNLIGLDSKRSLSYTEDSAREDRTKMV